MSDRGNEPYAVPEELQKEMDEFEKQICEGDGTWVAIRTHSGTVYVGQPMNTAADLMFPELGTARAYMLQNAYRLIEATLPVRMSPTESMMQHLLSAREFHGMSQGGALAVPRDQVEGVYTYDKNLAASELTKTRFDSRVQASIEAHVKKAMEEEQRRLQGEAPLVMTPDDIRRQLGAGVPFGHPGPRAR